MRVTIIVNPVAGRGRAYRKLRQYVKRWPHEGWQVEILSSRCPEHAGEIAHELLSSPPDLLAICGGDGTVNEVVSRVPDPPFPVAVLPAGTANVLGRELGVPLDPISALQAALTGRTRRMDLGVLKARSERRFLLMAGIGFDAYIVAKVRPALKARFGMAAYFITVLQQLPPYTFPEFQVITETGTYTATSCIVANVRGYGGGLVFCPEANPWDGVFNVLILQGNSWVGYARFLRSAQRGKPQPYPWIQRCRSRTVRIEGPRGIWVQADGELAGTLPVEITLIPSSYPLVVLT